MGYDALGMRSSVSGSMARTGLPQPVPSAAYDGGNELLSWNESALSYDSNGDMLSDGTNAFTWDARNQLATLNGVAPQYDAFGRRAKNPAGTSFLFDGANSTQELSGSTVTANLMTGGLDELFQRSDTSGTVAPLTDALGSMLALANSSGTVQTQYTYDPFGSTTVGGTASNNPSQYTGRENDGTGLYYYRARYYNPTTGRFLSEDPIGFMAGANFYAYVGGNPLRYRDPFGLSPFNFGSASTCFLKGAGNGALGALLVGGLAVGAATLGAPVAAVTVGLGALAIGGGALLGYDVYNNISNSNWNGLAYNLGSLIGSSAVGGAGGRAIAEGITGVDSPPWSWSSDMAQGYDPALGSPWDWLGTGPNPGSAGGSAAFGGAGAASMAGRSCGCN
jgi:RHS repeat-associated protein